MKHAKAAYEAISGATKIKSQGWLGILILRHCGGCTPQEFATPAKINMAKLTMAKARSAARLQNLHGTSAAADDKKRGEESPTSLLNKKKKRAEAKAKSAQAANFMRKAKQ